RSGWRSTPSKFSSGCFIRGSLSEWRSGRPGGYCRGMGGVNVGLFVFPTVTVGDREAMIDRRPRHVASEIYAACQAGRIEVLEPPRASAGWDFDQTEPGGRIRQLRPPAHHQSDRITIIPELDLG